MQFVVEPETVLEQILGIARVEIDVFPEDVRIRRHHCGPIRNEAGGTRHVLDTVVEQVFVQLHDVASEPDNLDPELIVFDAMAQRLIEATDGNPVGATEQAGNKITLSMTSSRR